MKWMKVAPAAPALLVAGLLSGCSADSFVKDIDQPPAVVAAAIEDLDVRTLPHTKAELGADAAMPDIRALRTADGFEWKVMSGEETALAMTATLEPIKGGAGTRVHGRVEDGHASHPEAVAALFRSRREMEKLFGVALEIELGDYIPRSERSLLSLQERPYGSAAERNAAFAEGFAAVARVHREGAAAGLGVDGPPIAAMGEDGSRQEGNSDLSFEPGKPMVDVKR